MGGGGLFHGFILGFLVIALVGEAMEGVSDKI
jgi:hypothetical protein